MAEELLLVMAIWVLRSLLLSRGLCARTSAAFLRRLNDCLFRPEFFQLKLLAGAAVGVLVIMVFAVT